MSLVAAFLAGLLVGGAGAWWTVSRAAAVKEEEFGRLFSFAAHEINTPVTAVNMTILNMLTGVFGDLPDDLVPWMEMTREQVARLSALVGELRDLVHIHMRRDLRLSIGPARPDEIVEQAVVALKRGMAQAGVDLMVDSPKDLPTVRTDDERAARSLTSLLFHARKFRVRGPVGLAVKRRESARVAFTVVYEGSPMTAAEAGETLELLYPARRRKDHLLAATGLGLGLVRSVLRITGGELEFAVDAKGRAVLTMLLPEEAA